MYLKKKNIANNETIERYHNSISLGKRWNRAVAVCVGLRYFRKKSVWGLIFMTVKERKGSWLIAKLLALVTAWVVVSIGERGNIKES